ncbi:MAG: SRPBCC family protein [Acidimicrobiales bacterium]
MSEFTPHPDLDLVLERTIPVAPERVWAAWTEPELLMKWFTPAPWKTVAAELDVRPGGRCVTTMESPEGERYPNAGCYLEVEPNRLLVFTSVMTEGFRPTSPSNGAEDLPFTGRIEIMPDGNGGSRYRAIAVHADPDGCRRHAEMGFHQGWGAALDQLVALMS